jgi:hypothetical protein
MADLEILEGLAADFVAAAKQERKASEFPKDTRLKIAVRRQRKKLLQAAVAQLQALELDEVPDQRYRQDLTKQRNRT